MPVDERTFAAEVAGWVTEVLNGRPDLPFSHALVEDHAGFTANQAAVPLDRGQFFLDFPGCYLGNHDGAAYCIGWPFFALWASWHAYSPPVAREAPTITVYALPCNILRCIALHHAGSHCVKNSLAEGIVDIDLLTASLTPRHPSCKLRTTSPVTVPKDYPRYTCVETARVGALCASLWPTLDR